MTTQSVAPSWRENPSAALVQLAWPLTISMLSNSLMALIDTLFVGRLGAASLVAVGIGGVVAFTVMCFGFAPCGPLRCWCPSRSERIVRTVSAPISAPRA